MATSRMYANPRALLSSAAAGAAAVALPPVLLSTLITPIASPESLPASTAPPLASPLPISATATDSAGPTPTPAPPPAAQPSAPSVAPSEGVEPSGAPPSSEREREAERAAESSAATPQLAPEVGLDVDITDANSCPSLLDGTKPHVARAGWHLIRRFGLGTSQIIGRAARSRASEHPLGLALDFMVDRATGDRLSAYVLDNMDRLGVKYVLWEQSYNSGSGWQRMEDRGGATANHFDHVHLSFRSSNDDAAELTC